MYFCRRNLKQFLIMGRVFVVLFLSALCSLAFGQEQTEEMPQYGLVLSGGGALGFAHIGVIMALEEAGIDISMVSGASM